MLCLASRRLLRAPTLLQHSNILRVVSVKLPVAPLRRVMSTQTGFYEVQWRREPLSPTQKMNWSLALAGSVTALTALYLYGRRTDAEKVAASVDSVAYYPAFVRERINRTYMYVVGGLAITAATAASLFQAGLAHRMLGMSPWALLVGSLVGGIGSMILTTSLDYNSPLKVPAWMMSMAVMGATLCPIGFYGGPLILKAAAYTGTLITSLSVVSAAAPSDSFLWMGGGLGIGLGLVCCASIGRMFFPASSLLMNVSLYGGLTVFSGLMLYDTQRAIMMAKNAAVYDPINQSYGIYLNAINIFTHILQILAMQQQRKR